MLPCESGFFHLPEGVGDPSVLCFGITFFLLLPIFHCMMYYTLFIHLPTVPHLGCFQSGAIANKAAANICV